MHNSLSIWGLYEIPPFAKQMLPGLAFRVLNYILECWQHEEYEEKAAEDMKKKENNIFFMSRYDVLPKFGLHFIA